MYDAKFPSIQRQYYHAIKTLALRRGLLPMFPPTSPDLVLKWGQKICTIGGGRTLTLLPFMKGIEERSSALFMMANVYVRASNEWFGDIPGYY